MILRKPYAVFIKYFKILHIILGVLSASLFYTSFTLYRFFNSYSIDFRAALTDYSSGKFVNIISFIIAIVTLILSIVLLSVMIYKNKPKRLYIFNVILYIGVIVFYSVCSSVLGGINNTVLDIKVSKALRDFALIAALLQSVSMIFTFVRATGFDIKQFDFGTDLQKLDISEADSEEIEVAIAFDKDETKRRFRNRIRNIKYVYFEHKFVINMAFLIIFCVGAVLIYFNVRSYSVTVNEEKNFDVSNVTMNVQDSFILENDSNGNSLIETKGDLAGAIVAIRFQVKGYGVKEKLNTGLFTLRIGDLSYGQSSTIAAELSDIGTAYTNQELSDDFKTYIIAFEISKNQANKRMNLKVNDNYSFVKGIQGAKSYYVSLKPEDLRKEGQSFEKKLGENIDFSDSIMGSSYMKIDSFDISNSFKLPYKMCLNNDKCIDSNEFVTVSATGNYFKALMRFTGNSSFDNTLNIKEIYDLRTFLNYFGSINYSVNGVSKSYKINSQHIKPKVAQTNDVFIEVPYEVLKSEAISLTFKIRNQNYKYVLK